MNYLIWSMLAAFRVEMLQVLKDYTSGLGGQRGPRGRDSKKQAESLKGKLVSGA